MTSEDCRRAVGARPLYFPSDAALAMPSRCRSSISERSNSATAPSIVIDELAGRRPRIDLLASHGEDHQADLALREVIHDGEQIAHRSSQAVRLCRHQHVAIADEPQRLIELWPFTSRAGLFGKGSHLRCGDACTSPTGDLGCRPSALARRRAAIERSLLVKQERRDDLILAPGASPTLKAAAV